MQVDRAIHLELLDSAWSTTQLENPFIGLWLAFSLISPLAILNHHSFQLPKMLILLPSLDSSYMKP